MAERRTAAKEGVSWRRWNGWEPRRVTAYEYDASGLLIRAVETTEAEYDDDTRAWAIALQAYEDGLCDGCGRPLSETTAPEREGRYVPDGHLQCHRCTGIERAVEAIDPDRNPRHRTYRHQIKTLPVPIDHGTEVTAP